MINTQGACQRCDLLNTIYECLKLTNMWSCRISYMNFLSWQAFLCDGHFINMVSSSDYEGKYWKQRN